MPASLLPGLVNVFNPDKVCAAVVIRPANVVDAAGTVSSLTSVPLVFFT
jgi:hypothetical protein